MPFGNFRRWSRREWIIAITGAFFDGRELHMALGDTHQERKADDPDAEYRTLVTPTTSGVASVDLPWCRFCACTFGLVHAFHCSLLDRIVAVSVSSNGVTKDINPARVRPGAGFRPTVRQCAGPPTAVDRRWGNVRSRRGPGPGRGMSGKAGDISGRWGRSMFPDRYLYNGECCASSD